MTEYTIKIDATDWVLEATRDELMPSTQEDIINALKAGITTSSIARATIASRLLHNAPDDILSEDKFLLMKGAMSEVIALAKTDKVDVQAESGKIYHANGLVGKGNRKDGKEEENKGEQDEEPQATFSYVPAQSDEAFVLARQYIERIIPGHIWGRLLILYLNNGDVREAADTLKDTIDDMVDRLIEPVPA